VHDPRHEARRWWAQAEDDASFVRDLAREARYFDKACFIAQQAAEKAVQACVYATGRREVFGHAVLEFTHDLAAMDPAFKELASAAARLDRYYIPTRYPNALPGGAPFQSYTAGDLAAARGDMETVFIVAERFLRSRGVLGESI
jgi:HEPN domain-containing protein